MADPVYLDDNKLSTPSNKNNNENENQLETTMQGKINQNEIDNIEFNEGWLPIHYE